MYTHLLRPDELQSISGPFDGTATYAHTKRQIVALTEAMARKYPNMEFFSCHPGWAETPGVQTSIPGFYSAFKNVLRSAAEGADTVIWLSISDEVQQKHPNSSGEFWFGNHGIRSDY
jgi:dehydrogenase/reductase SDR family protein 12